MAIRLRQVNGCWVALCAVESDAKEGDIYLDDSQHYALSHKFARENDLWETEKWLDELADSQKVRDAGEELEKWQSEQQIIDAIQKVTM